MSVSVTFCTNCATRLESIAVVEDGGDKVRLRCPACGWTHWNNPTPVLAAVIECVDREGQILLARNAAWPGKFYGLVTGFMEAGETPEEGIAREVGEETSLTVESLSLIGVYEFLRMNQVIIAYHAKARGEIVLSPELVDYRTVAPERVKCWPAGTGRALADWLISRGIEPQWLDVPPGKRATEIDVD
ncbi:MAG: NUDIX domain-containing protein [Caldimonas sp.]